MLTLYLISLAVGGSLLGASLLFGGDADADMDMDVDADIDIDADMDADIDGHVDAGHGFGADAVFAWLPFGSLRFWVFFLAFFGLCGTLLTTAASMVAPLVGVVSGAFGYLSGVTTTTIMKRLQKNDVDSSLRANDYIGIRGQVTVPIGRGTTGKVRLELKGRVVELLAQTDDDTRYEYKDSVMIYDVRDDGTFIVTKTDQLEA